MNYLDFTCPICGGIVSCKLNQSRCKYRFPWVSLDYRCNKCGEWIDIDITIEITDAKEQAQNHFAYCVSRIEGGEMCSNCEDHN